MPTAVSYPGVYIEEVPSGVRTITGVATSITAFVGSAPKGPSNKPVRIQNFADYERQFGGLQTDYMLSYAVSHFFANGGTDAIVVRILNDVTAKAAFAKLPIVGDPTKNLELEARHKGAWGMGLRLHIDHNTKDPQATELFNLYIKDTVSGTVEEFRNLSMKKSDLRFVTTVLESDSTLVRVKRDTTVPSEIRPAAQVDPKDMFATEFKDVRFTLGEGDGLSLKLVPEGEFKLTPKAAGGNPVVTPPNLAGRVVQESAGRFSLVLKNLTTGVVETIRSLTKDNVVARLAAESQESQLVTAATTWEKPLKPHASIAQGIDVFSFKETVNSKEVKSYAEMEAKSGDDGLHPSDGDIVGSRADKTGIFALEEADLFNLLCLPPLSRDLSLPPETWQAALIYCLERRAMLLVDAPAEANTIEKAERAVNDVRASLGANDSRNAAIFFPRLRMADPKQENRPADFAPCGAVAGIFAKTDAQRGVWKAPAGIEAGIGGVREFTVKMTDPQNGRLNQLGLNCLRNFPVYGNLVWGSRTLAGADALASEHKYIPVRRLQLFIEESLYRGTQWVVFEPNDEPLWAQIRLNVGVFMQGLFRKGAFQGRTPNEAFFVRCDKTTTTKEDINLGIVNIDVGFAPLKPAEFVVIRIQQIAGDLTA